MTNEEFVDQVVAHVAATASEWRTVNSNIRRRLTDEERQQLLPEHRDASNDFMCPLQSFTGQYYNYITQSYNALAAELIVHAADNDPSPPIFNLITPLDWIYLVSKTRVRLLAAMGAA